ncbi:MAG TPA: S41 family peptidase [Terriglobia bacterium]|nr:S41 family peptidase [Terriglobia bacterium]
MLLRPVPLGVTLPNSGQMIRLLMLLVGSFVSVAVSSAQSLDGVWRSRGYGDVFRIQGRDLREFQVTSKTCVAGFIARRLATPDREAAFKIAEGGVLLIKSGHNDDHKLLHFDFSDCDIRIDRLPQMPTLCDPPTADTPRDNYEVFTRTFAENYISFDLKQTNWDKVVADNRARVTSTTTPAQLFDILEAMIKPFGDIHTGIDAPQLKRQFEGIRPGTDRILNGQTEEEFRKSDMRKLLAAIDRAWLKDPVRNFCNDQIQYGHIDNVTGYLRIVSFSSYSRHGGIAQGLMALESALDAIFSDPALRALVIDVRINFGGSDQYGLAVASRLATSEYLAFSIQARADPVDRNKWTEGYPVMVRPSPRPGFKGPVVELIGPYTLSAGETFTQALMGRTPQITRIGENTQGVFSDVLERRLPNRWSFGLPNEVYRTSEGAAFDGLGIPPDIAVPVFADDDVAGGRDPAIGKALELLKDGK